jgi:hypothetical protein
MPGTVAGGGGGDHAGSDGIGGGFFSAFNSITIVAVSPLRFSSTTLTVRGNSLLIVHMDHPSPTERPTRSFAT